MVWAALADASSALLGTQPVHRQSPPTRARSTTATRSPRVAANSAATMPPDPIPTITRSYRAMTPPPEVEGVIKVVPAAPASQAGHRTIGGMPFDGNSVGIEVVLGLGALATLVSLVRSWRSFWDATLTSADRLL